MDRQSSTLNPIQSAGRPAITVHDRLWAEMQLKLEDIELSASASHNGSFVAPALWHGNEALEDLRVAQVSLAQAWRRNKEDNADDNLSRPITSTTAASTPNDRTTGGDPTEGVGAGVSAGVNDNSNKEHHTKEGVEDEHDHNNIINKHSDIKPFYLEDKTHADIQSARKRREANDQHFGKVSKGVLDVVQKLDTVAKSMIVVEESTREIWADDNINASDSFSEDSSSVGGAR